MSSLADISSQLNKVELQEQMDPKRDLLGGHSSNILNKDGIS